MSDMGRHGDSMHAYMVAAYNEWCSERSADVIDRREVLAALAVLFVQAVANGLESVDEFDEKIRGARAYLDAITENQRKRFMLRH